LHVCAHSYALGFIYALAIFFIATDEITQCLEPAISPKFPLVRKNLLGAWASDVICQVKQSEKSNG
jgi:hypothetical protein